MSKRTKQISIITDAKSHSAQAISSIFNLKEDRKLQQLNFELELRVEKLKSGNCEDIEELLLTQAYTLDCLFTQLTIKGVKALSIPEIVSNMPNLPKSLLNLALKAQNQSRSTLQTINEIKNPKRTTTFVKNYVDKQLNQLSINNKEPQQSVELGESSNAKMDFRSQAEAVRNTSKKEAVEIQHRTNNR